MNFTDLPLLDTMRARMSFLSARQTVLSQNVANADTPGYRAQDIEEPDFAALTQGLMSSTAMRLTDPRHIAPSNGAAVFRAADMPDAESTPDGNSVVLEQQMMKVAATQMDYSTVTQLYKNALGMIRMASAAPR